MIQFGVAHLSADTSRVYIDVLGTSAYLELAAVDSTHDSVQEFIRRCALLDLDTISIETLHRAFPEIGRMEWTKNERASYPSIEITACCEDFKASYITVCKDPAGSVQRLQELHLIAESVIFQSA